MLSCIPRLHPTPPFVHFFREKGEEGRKKWSNPKSASSHSTTSFAPNLQNVPRFLRSSAAFGGGCSSSDSVRTVVLTRDLTKEEKEYLLANKFVARTTKVAHDALALIVNRSNKDTLLLDIQFADIFKGKITNWKQINPASADLPINIVFDNNKSGNVRYFREKFDISGNFPANCFAVNNNEEVIKYVKNNPSALGIISVNWISDTQDSVSEKFLEAVRIVEVGTNTMNYCKPYQGYIADRSYPFCRDVFMVSRETFSGLGTGFASFVAGDQGQRIILKSGLVPATMPIRLIQIKKD